MEDKTETHWLVSYTMVALLDMPGCLAELFCDAGIRGKKRNTSAFTSPSTWREVYPSSHFCEVKVPFGATEDTKMSLFKNLTAKDVVSLAVFISSPFT